MKPVIMIVDSSIENQRVLKSFLVAEYNIICCGSGGEAMRQLLAAENLPQLLIMDTVMPDIDGYKILEAIKKHWRLKEMPVICVAKARTEKKALRLGAQDYIAKPFNPDVVRMRIHNQISLKRHMDKLESMVEEKVAETVMARDHMLVVLADIIEHRSIESGSHVKRVAQYTEILLKDLMKNSPYVEELRELGPEVLVKSVPMHDVGKIGIPDNILLKPGKLTPEEFEVMKTHTSIGKSIIDSIMYTGKVNSDFLENCASIAYCHHEWFDGSGYPQGLAGQDIPLGARIMAVVDVYDALVTKRVYKEAYAHTKAMEIIMAESGTHLDPVVVDAFGRTAGQCRKVMRDAVPTPS